MADATPVPNEVRTALVDLVSQLLARLHEESAAEGARWAPQGAIGSAYEAVAEFAGPVPRPARHWCGALGLRTTVDVHEFLDAIRSEERMFALRSLLAEFE